MHEQIKNLKERVLHANLLLKQSNLITLTWGNVSEIDRESGLIAIKPSGVDYDCMTVNDIVITDINGKTVDGRLKPSSDLDTHLQIYKSFTNVNGVAHTHSKWATIFAQAGKSIPMLGTTHADTFYGDVPCTRRLTKNEIEDNYEKETGNVIVETFSNKDYLAIPAVVVCSHGPFTWGKDAITAVQNSIVLEEVAMMAYHTLTLNPKADFDNILADKHYYRKHGANAYYGQGEKK
jgi:L-ribulose-5-phosphate 4-epimerase